MIVETIAVGAAELAISSAVGLVKGKIAESLDGVIDYKSNITELKAKVEMLGTKLEDIRAKAKAKPANEILAVVQLWISDCEKAIKECNNLIENKESKSSDLFLRFSDGSEAQKAIIEANRLLQFRIDQVTTESLLPRDFMPPGLYFLKLAWYDQALAIIMEGQNSLIGLSARPRSGLSTFMKYLSREFLLMFDTVIFLGQEINTLELVQRELGLKLGIWSLDESRELSTSHRCSVISRTLERMRYSIVFETVLAPVDLEAVGVVFTPGTKVVFGTTRPDVMVAMRPSVSIELQEVDNSYDFDDNDDDPGSRKTVNIDVDKRKGQKRKSDGRTDVPSYEKVDDIEIPEAGNPQKDTDSQRMELKADESYDNSGSRSNKKKRKRNSGNDAKSGIEGDSHEADDSEGEKSKKKRKKEKKKKYDIIKGIGKRIKRRMCIWAKSLEPSTK